MTNVFTVIRIADATADDHQMRKAHPLQQVEEVGWVRHVIYSFCI
jgi:hypothetical protein